MQQLHKARSMMCYPSIPDNTPLAYIFARQKHTLTKKQLQGVADALMSEPRYTRLATDPFHVVLYAGEKFYANPSAITDSAEKEGDHQARAQLVVNTCLNIANNCRNARSLKMYINKMVHDMNVREDKSSRVCKYCDDYEAASACDEHSINVERGERCATF